MFILGLLLGLLLGAVIGVLISIYSLSNPDSDELYNKVMEARKVREAYRKGEENDNED